MVAPKGIEVLPTLDAVLLRQALDKEGLTQGEDDSLFLVIVIRERWYARNLPVGSRAVPLYGMNATLTSSAAMSLSSLVKSASVGSSVFLHSTRRRCVPYLSLISDHGGSSPIMS